MEGKPCGQKHDLDRHHRNSAPGKYAVEREQNASEDVAICSATPGQNGFASAPQVIGVGRISDHLERKIRLNACAHVEIAIIKEGPAAMRALNATQIGSDLGFEPGVDCLSEIVAQQYVFGRDRGIGLEFKNPVSVHLLATEKHVCCPLDARFDLGFR